MLKGSKVQNANPMVALSLGDAEGPNLEKTECLFQDLSCPSFEPSREGIVLQGQGVCVGRMSKLVTQGPFKTGIAKTDHIDHSAVKDIFSALIPKHFFLGFEPCTLKH